MVFICTKISRLKLDTVQHELILVYQNCPQHDCTAFTISVTSLLSFVSHCLLAVRMVSPQKITIRFLTENKHGAKCLLKEFPS